MHPLGTRWPTRSSACRAAELFLALRDGNAAHLPYAAQGSSPIPVIAGDNYGNEFAAPVPSKRLQKDRDHVRPSPWFRNRLKTELSVENVQIMVCRNDEDTIGLEN